MKKLIEKKWFSRGYLYVAKAKTTACLFYSYTVFMYVFLGWAGNAPVQTLDVYTALQMFICSAVIGFSQPAILPKENITLLRSVIWSVFCTAAAACCAAAFGWFASFPVWCVLVFYGILVGGFLFMVLHLHILTRAETRQLNEQLHRFQAGEERKTG